MTRRREKYRAGRTVKTSISLSETVNTWAEKLASKKGYDNFSSYVADLIRRDKERDDEQTGRPPPADPDTSLFLNEPKPRPK